MSSRRRPSYGAALGLVVILLGLLTGGCSDISAQMNDETVASTPDEGSTRPILVTRQWGVVDGMLSVVVRNTTDRTLRSAEAVISARDDNDVLLATSLEGPGGVCCSVVDLPPGQQFGFYVDVGDSATDISRVDVAYRDVAWATADVESEVPLHAHAVGLESSARGAVVVAHVGSTSPLVVEASVQAFLNGPDGEFLAVVAGRWFCFSKGGHEIRMQLLHQVPAGTTIDRVVIHPVTEDPSGTTFNCAGPASGG